MFFGFFFFFISKSTPKRRLVKCSLAPVNLLLALLKNFIFTLLNKVRFQNTLTHNDFNIKIGKYLGHSGEKIKEFITSRWEKFASFTFLSKQS